MARRVTGPGDPERDQPGPGVKALVVIDQSGMLWIDGIPSADLSGTRQQDRPDVATKSAHRIGYTPREVWQQAGGTFVTWATRVPTADFLDARLR